MKIKLLIALTFLPILAFPNLTEFASARIKGHMDFGTPIKVNQNHNIIGQNISIFLSKNLEGIYNMQSIIKEKDSKNVVISPFEKGIVTLTQDKSKHFILELKAKTNKHVYDPKTEKYSEYVRHYVFISRKKLTKTDLQKGVNFLVVGKENSDPRNIDKFVVEYGDHDSQGSIFNLKIDNSNAS